MDNPAVLKSDEIEKPLVAAYRERVDAEIKRTGGRGDAVQMAAPIRQQLSQGGWNLAQYYKMRDQCQANADAGMVKFRATAGAQDALNCWGYLANKAPGHADTVFLEHDIKAALDRSQVYYVTQGRAMNALRDEVKSLLANAVSTAVEARFGGCAPKVRSAILNIAYGAPPSDIPTNSKLILALRFELIGTPAASQFGPMLTAQTWRVSSMVWRAWLGSPEAANAVICARERPLRKGAPAGAMAPIDIGLRLLTDAGANPAEALPVFSAALVQPNGFQSVVGIAKACTTWGEAAALRYGQPWFEGSALN
jgi:hypothetical protein